MPTRLLILAALLFSIMAAGCASRPRKPPVSLNPNQSQAMQVALASGITGSGGTLKDHPAAEVEAMKDKPSTYANIEKIPGRQSSLGLVGDALSLALAVVDPLSGIGKAGTAAIFLAPGVGQGGGADLGGITSLGKAAAPAGTGFNRSKGSIRQVLKATAGNDKLPHLVAWVDAGDENDVVAKITSAVERAVIAASGQAVERKTEWQDSLLGIHSEWQVLARPDCQGRKVEKRSTWFMYGRDCSSRLSIETTDIPEASPPPPFLKTGQQRVGPVEIGFLVDGILPPRGDSEAVHAWWKRFSAALPEGYYYYSPLLKGAPLVLNKGNEMWFISGK